MNIEVVPYDPRWKEIYADEARRIANALCMPSLKLHHIGSTSIPGAVAKPVIDILGVVPNLKQIDANLSMFEELGYEILGENGIVGRRFFRKLGTNSERTHHFHLFGQGAPEIEQHLIFKHFLAAHPDKLAQYSALKTQLINSDLKSRADYVEGKAPFIEALLKDAQSWCIDKKAKR